MTGEEEEAFDRPEAKGKDRAAVSMGKRGGKARAQAMTPAGKRSRNDCWHGLPAYALQKRAEPLPLDYRFVPSGITISGIMKR